MKHVVITGASRGLGRAMAIGFAAEGWTVSGCGTDAAALQLLAGELGQDHHLQACNVTDPAAVEEFAAAVAKRFGAPDLLVNNAATINPNKPLWEVTPDEFSRVIDINLKGVHLIIRAFLPGMIQRGKGVWWQGTDGPRDVIRASPRKAVPWRQYETIPHEFPLARNSSAAETTTSTWACRINPRACAI